MASPFARFGFSRFRALSPTSRLFLGVSGSLGVYYASTFTKLHADTNTTSPQQGRRENSHVNPYAGVHRVDSVFWPANYPSEDVLTSMHVRPMSWSFWSVYDGHVGPQTSWFLEKHLLPNLSDSLRSLYSQGKQPQAEAIHSVIKNVFLALDDEIVTKPAQLLTEQPEGTPLRAMAANILQTARAGSCALVAFYDSNVRSLHVSVVGDSRAILGRRRKTDDGTTIYDVHVLSADQNGKNPAEVARLEAAHPGETLFNERGRFLGWGITRSFGNGVLKWSRELQTFMQEKCLGDKPRDTVKTPPYATAMPEITTTAIEPGDFMVMASDGLWDCLTNEEVVGLVGLWLKRQDDGVANMQSTGEEQIVERAHLPVELKDDKLDGNYEYWKAKKQFVNVDSNVARHLARNALGGADKDLHTALLSTPAPRARYFKDDVSAIVVFFE